MDFLDKLKAKYKNVHTKAEEEATSCKKWMEEITEILNIPLYEALSELLLKLTAETENFLQLCQEQGVDGGHDHQAQEGDFAEQQAEFNDKTLAHFDGSIKRFSVPSAGVSNGIPIDVIKPKDSARRPGILVSFQEDVTVCSSPKTLQVVSILLARELKCVVVNVQYRQAPEHKFPAMFDDGKAVARWVLMNKSLVGAENDSKVGVIGYGAGGGVALTVAFEVPGIDYQILVYPLVDWRCQGASYRELEFPGSSFNMCEKIRRYVESRIRSEADRASVRASPVLRKDFTALPPTLLLIAEVDPFKDSNYELKSKMKIANVVCESKLMKGAIQGFFSTPGLFQDAHQRAREIIAQFYKKHGVC